MKNNEIKKILESSLSNEIDMALKRRAINIILGLHLKDGDNILDLGCGPGYYINLIKSLGLKLKIVGLDLDKDTLEKVRRDNPDIKVYEGSIYKLPFPDNSFDKIILSEVLEHLEDDKKALKEVRRVLKPGGTLCISVPNANYPFLWDPINWVAERLFNTHVKSGRWAGIWTNHIRLYARDQLKDLLTKSGFKVEKIEPMTWFTLPFNHFLLYGGNLPTKLTNSIYLGLHYPLTSLLIGIVSMCDKLNELRWGFSSVGIFVKARNE